MNDHGHGSFPPAASVPRRAAPGAGRPARASARRGRTAARLTRAAFFAAAVALACAGCRIVTGAGPAPSVPGPAPSASGGGLAAVHDPGTVTGTLTGPCHARDGAQLPDPRCTPGSIDPAVTQASIRQTICVTGYTATVRPPETQTERFKYDVAYPAYGVPGSEPTELDHLVPLELGGSNDARNLWPEYPPSPNPKDKVELALRDAVCAGRVSLAAAQRAIAVNWITAEHVLGVSPAGGP